MMMKESCIISRIAQGLRPQPSTKSRASARPAPRPSKTELKQSAARMIQRNIALMPSVWRTVASIIGQFSRPRPQAARVAARAPTALELGQVGDAEEEEAGHREEDDEGHEARRAAAGASR